MTQLAAEIIRIAYDWVSRCKGTIDHNNAGGCVDAIQRAYDGTTGRHEAYCAKFGYIVVRDACKKLGIPNALPKTAGARDLEVKAAKAGIPVNKSPARGALFYHKPEVAGSTGHVGIVVDLFDRGFKTVEGNHSNQVREWTYYYEKPIPSGAGNLWANPALDWVFIHTETIGNTPDDVSNVAQAGFGGVFGWLLIGGLLWWGITR